MKDMTTILITGGSGFLGAHILEKARPKYHVIATCHKNTLNWDGIDWHRIDFLQQPGVISTLIDTYRPAIVIHTAAMSSVDTCETYRDVAHQINVSPTAEIVAACARQGIRLIYTSSDMVYEGTKMLYTENDDAKPLNYYGLTKLQAETIIRQQCEDYVIARVALIYGRPHSGSISFSENIFQKLVAGEQVHLFSDQYRSPILVDNLADILIELCEQHFCGVLNVGGPERVDRYSFIKYMVSITGHDSGLLKKMSMDDLKLSAARPRDVSMNIGLLKDVVEVDIIDYRSGLETSYMNKKKRVL